jgi:phytoene dehydrogenase-like protein
MPRADVLVVGGGLAGLAAATYLARAGAHVALFEKSSNVGGRARTLLRNGYLWNLGPHALYAAGAGRGVLQELGVPIHGAAAPGGYALKAGRRHTLPIGPFSLLTTGLLRLSARLEMGRVLAGLPRIDARAVAGTSLGEWLDSNVSQPDTRELLEAFFRVTTYVGDTSRLSAGAALRQLQSALAGGVLYLHGGWQTLVEGLRTAGETAGVLLHRGAFASEALFDDGRVRGLLLSTGEVWEADHVLAAIDPESASALLPGGLGDGLRSPKHIPVTVACLDLSLQILPSPGTVFALGIDTPTYFSVHSETARLAPQGGAVIHLLAYQKGVADPAQDARRLEELADFLQPGWRGVVVDRRFAPGLVVSNALPTPEREMAGRSADVAEAPGFYLAGDWVGSEGMLADAALTSARSAAAAILARLRAGRAAA